jgi:hypothetical protein
MKRTNSRPRSKSATRVAAPHEGGDAWVLVHVEFMGCTAHPRLDSLLSHVASSCEAAIARARRIYTDPIGWWELFRFTRDGEDIESDEQSGIAPELYLDHRGRVVERPNVKRARAHFDSKRLKEIAAGVFPDGEHQCQVCHAAQRAPARAKSKRSRTAR